MDAKRTAERKPEKIKVVSLVIPDDFPKSLVRFIPKRLKWYRKRCAGMKVIKHQCEVTIELPDKTVSLRLMGIHHIDNVFVGTPVNDTVVTWL